MGRKTKGLDGSELMIADSMVAKSMAKLVDCRYSLGYRYRECPHCHKQIKRSILLIWFAPSVRVNFPRAGTA